MARLTAVGFAGALLLMGCANGEAEGGAQDQSAAPAARTPPESSSASPSTVNPPSATPSTATDPAPPSEAADKAMPPGPVNPR